MTQAQKVVFFSKSADTDIGFGVKETGWDQLPQFEYAAYLHKPWPPHWRRLLSNFDTSVDFTYDGLRFRSIEHAFQYAKISLPEQQLEPHDRRAYAFTLDSNSALGQGSGATAQRNRKMLHLAPEDLMRWDMISDATMDLIAQAKYKLQPPSLCMQVLLMTRGAELYHLVQRRIQPSQLVRFTHLERIRDACF